MKAMSRLADKGRASVRSRAPVRSGFIAVAGAPSRVLSVSVPSSKPTIETRTAAPFSIQGRSDSAKKMPPVYLMRASTRRLATPLMEFVASSPARFARPPSISFRAFSNQ